jgi:ribonucleoside-diphosphate reductase alpha chain
VPNWVTHQVVEQCQWSGVFDEAQLREIERQVRENTQVRFANISIKATDEFMQAVDEQTRYGPATLLVYRKFSRPTVHSAHHDTEHHYSFGIPAKDISTYEFAGDFATLEGLNSWLEKQGSETVTEAHLADADLRDAFGDVVRELPQQKYDLAIRYAGDFMLYFASAQTGEIRHLIKARDIWDVFIESNYHTAEPGLIFWSAMSKYSPSNYVDRPIACTNPCAEVPLEDGGACNLGSINLSRFVVDGYTEKARVDWQALQEVAQYAVRFLDNVVLWNEMLNPLEKQRRAASETRRLGLGVMGIADMVNQLGKMYDSDEAIELMERVMETICNAAYQSSALIAGEKGPSPIFAYDAYARCPFFQEALSDDTRALIKQHGLRNIAIMSIAPTGSISNIVLGFEHHDKHYIGVSGGVEPVFALYYSRRSESFGNQIFRVFHSTVQAYLDMHALGEEAQKKSLEEILPAHFLRTAHVIAPDMRVQVQGTCQKYVDHSISSTVNLSEDIEPEVISRIYLQAWKKGLKGITVYRDGSRYPILSVDGKHTPFQDIKNRKYSLRVPVAEAEGEKLRVHEVAGDDVLRMPDGRLTTVYHLLKRREQSRDESTKVSEALLNQN